MRARRSIILLAVVGAGAGLNATASAENFGIHFGVSGGGAGPGGTVTGTAGVVPISGWNNESGPSGASVPITSSDGSATAILTWASPNTWSSGAADDGGNDSLVGGYIDTNGVNTPTVSITGLGTTPYHVFLYVNGDASGRPSDYSVNGSDFAILQGQNNDPTGAGFLLATATQSGNYIDAGIISPDATGSIGVIANALNEFRSPINGIELVAAPEPASLGLIAIGALGLLRRGRRAERVAFAT